MSAPERLVRLFEDVSGRKDCSCGAALEFHETLNGKQMPVHAGAVPRKSELVDGRVVAYYAASDTHWDACPDRQRFSRR